MGNIRKKGREEGGEDDTTKKVSSQNQEMILPFKTKQNKIDNKQKLSEKEGRERPLLRR